MDIRLPTQLNDVYAIIELSIASPMLRALAPARPMAGLSGRGIHRIRLKLAHRWALSFFFFFPPSFFLGDYERTKFDIGRYVRAG